MAGFDDLFKGNNLGELFKDKKNRTTAYLSLAAIAIFLVLAASLPFKDKLFSMLFPKPAPYAQTAGCQTFFTLENDNTGYPVNTEIPVRVMARSDADLANLFAARMNFEADKLEVLRIEDTDSFVQEWAEEYYDNSSGLLALTGGVPSPGFQTASASAQMATVILRGLQVTEATAPATIDFTDQSMIFRDSDNQNILCSTVGTSFDITEASSSASPTPTATGSATPTASPTPAGLTCSFTAPASLNVGEVGTFTSTSSGNITSYNWSVSGGSPTSAISSTFNWSSSTAGSFAVTLTVSNGTASQACATNISVPSSSGGSAQSTPTPSPSPARPVQPSAGPVTGRGTR